MNPSRDEWIDKANVSDTRYVLGSTPKVGHGNLTLSPQAIIRWEYCRVGYVFYQVELPTFSSKSSNL